MRRLLICTSLLAAAACGNDKLKHVLPPNVHIEQFQQQGAGAVDVLWVVDNSGSMGPYQAAVGNNFDSFIKIFTRGSIDYRIAVTTTDVFHQKGQFQGNPAIITPQTNDVIGTFEQNVNVGINGSANSEGLAAAQLSIDTQSTVVSENRGCKANCAAADTACQNGCDSQFPINFLRPGAYLYIIFLQDDEDESPGDVFYYYRVFSEAKGVGNDGTVTAAAITGTGPPCGAGLGERFIQISLLTHGEYGKICDPNFADTLHRLANDAVGLKRKFALSNPPNIETLQVTIKYACNATSDTTGPCASINTDACSGQAADFQGLICTPVQGGTDGWVYEADTNVIYFAGNSVPDLHGEIDVEYYLQGTSPNG